MFWDSGIQEPAGNVTVIRDVICIRELENVLFEDGKVHCRVKWSWQYDLQVGREKNRRKVC